MKKYFYNYEIVDANLPEEGYSIGTDINESNIHIPLSVIQLQFLTDNTTASVFEVWNCKLEIIKEAYVVTPENSFNYDDFITSLFQVFSDSLDKIPSVFLELLKRRQPDADGSFKTYFNTLKNCLDQMKANSVLSDFDHSVIIAIFTKQNISLESY